MNAESKAVIEMNPDRTYNVRRITKDGDEKVFSLRANREIENKWIISEVVTGDEQTIDTGEAWLMLTQARAAGDHYVTDCLCAWCHPGLNPDGESSHGMCDSHLGEQLRQLAIEKAASESR